MRVGGRHGEALGIREGMCGGVAVEGEENGVSQQTKCVRVDKRVLGVLIMGAALCFNVK
jgi:hypothetical protein